MSEQQTDNRFRGQLNARPGVQLTGTNQFKNKNEKRDQSRSTVGVLRRAAASQYTRELPYFSLRKEVIQPQVLLRLPCYDFTPIMSHTLGRCLLTVS